jgi:hypothetical protein
MSDRSLGLVVPAYRPDVERLAGYVRDCQERLAPATVRVELDAPDPGVAEACREALPEGTVLNVAPNRRGKGAAITAGFEALEPDHGVLAFADADGSTPAASLAEIVAHVRPPDSGDAGGSPVGAADRGALAIGSRRHPDSRVVGHQTLARRRLGDAFAWLARRLLEADCYDYQCGAKAITADAWREVRDHLYEPGFAWDVELVAMTAALGLRVVEVPIEWEDQPGSTVDPVGTAFALGTALLTARHRAKRVQDSRLHDAIAATRERDVALVDRDRDRGD